MNNSLKINLRKKKSVTTISILIFAMLFTLLLSGCSREDFGTKLTFGDNNELYYTDIIKVTEAKALGDYLMNEGFFKEDDNERSVQLDKAGTTYEFRIVIKKGLEKDDDTIDLMKIFTTELSDNVFNGASVDIHLCDDAFKTLRVVVAQ